MEKSFFQQIMHPVTKFMNLTVSLLYANGFLITRAQSSCGNLCLHVCSDMLPMSAWVQISEVSCFQHFVERMQQRIKTVVNAKAGLIKVYFVLSC